jgi:hypothetical protein
MSETTRKQIRVRVNRRLEDAREKLKIQCEILQGQIRTALHDLETGQLDQINALGFVQAQGGQIDRLCGVIHALLPFQEMLEGGDDWA